MSVRKRMVSHEPGCLAMKTSLSILGILCIALTFAPAVAEAGLPPWCVDVSGLSMVMVYACVGDRECLHATIDVGTIVDEDTCVP